MHLLMPCIIDSFGECVIRCHFFFFFTLSDFWRIFDLSSWIFEKLIQNVVLKKNPQGQWKWTEGRGNLFSFPSIRSAVRQRRLLIHQTGKASPASRSFCSVHQSTVVSVSIVSLFCYDNSEALDLHLWTAVAEKLRKLHCHNTPRTMLQLVSI